MLDYVIDGATVVDGTGAEAFVGSVGLRDGRIAAVEAAGQISEPAANRLDATGLVLCPGFVDPHTHYDAQLFWDPSASPSSVHGVTTVLNGNCGFTLAPLHAGDADYTRRMMAKVEGMPLEVLETAVPWQWETFGEYLDALEGTVAVNAGWMIGHSALRRYVMGDSGQEAPASEDQLTSLRRVLAMSLQAGALGLTTDTSDAHIDGEGRAVPSRGATLDELLALCETVGEHEGTVLGGIFAGCSEGFSDAEAALLQRLSATAGRPLNWNVLVVDAQYPERLERHLLPSRLARQAGGRVVGLLMPVIVPMTMSFGTYCALNRMPGWGAILDAPPAQRMAMLAQDANRRMMESRATSEEAGQFRRLADFASYVIGDTFSDANKGLSGRRVADIARERGGRPFDTLVDIVLADDLRTVLWPSAPDDDDAHWALRAPLLAEEDILLGGSDAGAHLDRMCGGSYTTQFLADMLRGRCLLSMEQAVHLLTDRPARLFGLRDRGRVAPGWRADLVLFDPDTVASQRPRLVHDLPSGAVRLTAGAVGVQRVWVNGVTTVAEGTTTGSSPGTILRSGRDTATVSCAGAGEA